MTPLTSIAKHGILTGLAMLFYSTLILALFQRLPVILFISMGLLFYVGLTLRMRLWVSGAFASAAFSVALLLQMLATLAIALYFQLPLADTFRNSAVLHLSFWAPLGLGLMVGGFDRKPAARGV